MGHRLAQSFFLVPLGEAYVLAGRLADARELAGRALTFARQGGQRPYQAWALRLLGEVAARSDSPQHAEGYFRDARALAEELGMRPLVAHCHLGLGRLHRRTGQRQETHRHLTTAALMYREMGMPFWLEQAEEEIRLH